MIKIKPMVERTIFVLAILSAIIIQVITYLIPPFSEGGFSLQYLCNVMYYVPIALVLITFPCPTSEKNKIVTINILVVLLILSSMMVDYQVIKIFALSDTLPSNMNTLIWDKTYNLYWNAWTFQMSLIFLIFGLLYRFIKNDRWTAFRISAVGALIYLFSFEDIIYYPMHGENPFDIPAWSWLPQHNIYFGRPVTTIELIWIVSISMTLFFLFLVGFALKKKPASEIEFKAFSNKKEERTFMWSIPLILIVSISFVLIYLNTNIENNQIPFYMLLFYVLFLASLTIFSSFFPNIKRISIQLALIFVCYIIVYVVTTEMDWNAVENGFHWIDPLGSRKPPGDFWIWCDYRMAMWLIYLPIVIFLISLIFRFLGNSSCATLKLTLTNFLIMVLGIDSIVIFFATGGSFPPRWEWSNLHYSIFNGVYSLPVLMIFAAGLTCVIIYIHKKL